MERTRQKNKNISRFILILACLFLFLHAHSQSIDDVYRSQLGVRELTGNNDGQQVEKYLATTGLGKGYPWCAAFLSWCHDSANYESPRSAYSPDWFKTNVKYKRSFGVVAPKVTKGMVFGLYFESKKRVAHVGFIDYEDKNNYYTIEGNTNSAGSREGDGVYKKIRSKKSIYIISNFITKENEIKTKNFVIPEESMEGDRSSVGQTELRSEGIGTCCHPSNECYKGYCPERIGYW